MGAIGVVGRHIKRNSRFVVVIYIDTVKTTRPIKIPIFCGKQTHGTQTEFFCLAENLQDICLLSSEDTTPFHVKENNNDII